MYEFDDDGPPRWRKRVTRLFLLLALVAAGWFVVRPRLADGGESTNRPTFNTPTTEVATTEPATTEPATTEPATTEPATTVPETTVPETTESTTTEPPTTTSTSTTSSTTTLAPTTTEGTFASLPDGSPVPVVVILDDERVAITGAVPSPQAREDLLALVAASNQYPNAPFTDELSIDPNVPIGVGVRFLDLNSALFPEASPEILPDHAVQLDRIVALMNAYPNVTAVVVGHADQRGSGEANLLLSRQRAEAIVAYFVDHGIDGSRLSARAVGESDLLSVDDDEASLALNRRSELVINGLFVPASAAPTSAATTTTG
jgi:outer membrane protein OmpA-like peptidoglycan-associated protein